MLGRAGQGCGNTQKAGRVATHLVRARRGARR